MTDPGTDSSDAGAIRREIRERLARGLYQLERSRDRTDPDRQATLFGAKHAGIPGSTLLAGLAVPVIVVQYGWRWAFVAAAATALAVSSARGISRGRG